MDITAFFAAIANDTSIVPFVTEGWGVRHAQQSFIQGGSPARSNPLPFLYNIFGSDGSHLVYLSLTNITPSTYLVSNCGSLFIVQYKSPF